MLAIGTIIVFSTPMEMFIYTVTFFVILYFFMCLDGDYDYDVEDHLVVSAAIMVILSFAILPLIKATDIKEERREICFTITKNLEYEMIKGTLYCKTNNGYVEVNYD